MVVVWRNSCAQQLYAASPLSASGSGRDLGHTRVRARRPVRQDEVAAQSGPRRTSAGQSRFVLPDTRQSPPRRPGVVQWDLVVARGSPARSGRGPGSGTTTSHWTARPTSHFPLDYPGWRRARKRGRDLPPDMQRPAGLLPLWRGAPGDDTGGLRVGWLQWIRRQLSADRGCLAGSHLTHPKRNHSSDHLPSVWDHRTSAGGAAQRVWATHLMRRCPRRPPRTASGRAARRPRRPRAAPRGSPAPRSSRPPSPGSGRRHGSWRAGAR